MSMPKLVGLCVLTAVLLAARFAAAQAEGGKMSAAQRRAALLKQAQKGVEALPVLQAALQDENLVVRRTAIRLLGELGAAARPALAQGLENDDVLVRRAALNLLCDPPTIEALPYLQKAAQDAEPLMRLLAVQLLAEIKPRTQAIQELLEKARFDEVPAIRQLAAKAVWPFFKETVSVRDRKDWDHEIKVVQTIPLPLEGWRFKTDPKEEGHLLNWFMPQFNDESWQPIAIGKSWEEQGYTYDGVAWYRGTFELPAKPQIAFLAVEIVFEAVDEEAWVWLNGEYVGQHDLGPTGWDKPFALDVTKELKWGEKNQITVRVYDSAYAGGIWKPVRLEILQ